MLNESTCKRCFRRNGKAWDPEDWAHGLVFCPHEIVARRITHLPTKRLLGTVFGMTKISEVPAHCPHKDEHQEVCV
ncbi:MAG: hypothetical protein AB7F75_00885 [Planctomycetota bacterium]